MKLNRHIFVICFMLIMSQGMSAQVHLLCFCDMDEADKKAVQAKSDSLKAGASDQVKIDDEYYGDTMCDEMAEYSKDEGRYECSGSECIIWVRFLKTTYGPPPLYLILKIETVAVLRIAGSCKSTDQMYADEDKKAKKATMNISAKSLFISRYETPKIIQFEGGVKIKNTQNASRADIISLDGKLVYSIQNPDKNEEMNFSTSELLNGIYLVKTSVNGIDIVNKIIINN